jgi:hypothetical protein
MKHVRTLDQWIDLTRGGTVGLSDEQVRRIASRCLDAEANGCMSSIWHEAAAELGTPCRCARCEPPKGPPSPYGLRRVLRTMRPR